MSTEPTKPKSAADPLELPDDAQLVFDVVTGPNLRVKDNLIQLIAIVVGTILFAAIGGLWMKVSGNDILAGLLLGGLAGMILSLFLSGAILGLIRFIGAVKRR